MPMMCNDSVCSGRSILVAQVPHRRTIEGHARVALQTRLPLCANRNRGIGNADGGTPLSAAKGGKTDE